MKKGITLLFTLTAILALTTSASFAGQLISVAPHDDTNYIDPIVADSSNGGGPLSAAADLFWRTDGTGGGVWSTSTFWSNPASATGGSAWVSGDDAFFTATSTLTFGTTTVSDVTVSGGSVVTVTSGGTLTLGGVRTFDIGAGSALTWTSQTWSAAAGNEGAGIIKNGDGILNLGAIPVNVRYDGGFTLNAGTVIVSGDNSFGSAGGDRPRVDH